MADWGIPDLTTSIPAPGQTEKPDFGSFLEQLRASTPAPKPVLEEARESYWENAQPYVAPIQALVNLSGASTGAISGLLMPDAYERALVANMQEVPAEDRGDLAQTGAAAPGAGQTAMEALLPGVQENPWLQVVKTTGSIAGDIVTDPLTWVSGGAAAAIKLGKVAVGADKVADSIRAARAAYRGAQIGKLTSKGMDLARATQVAEDLAFHQFPKGMEAWSKARAGAEAAKMMLASPLAAAAYAPEVGMGVAEGVSGAVEAAGQGDVSAAGASGVQAMLMAGLAGLMGKGAIHELEAVRIAKTGKAIERGEPVDLGLEAAPRPEEGPVDLGVAEGPVEPVDLGIPQEPMDLGVPEELPPTAFSPAHEARLDQVYRDLEQADREAALARLGQTPEPVLDQVETQLGADEITSQEIQRTGGEVAPVEEIQAVHGIGPEQARGLQKDVERATGELEKMAPQEMPEASEIPLAREEPPAEIPLEAPERPAEALEATPALIPEGDLTAQAMEVLRADPGRMGLLEKLGERFPQADQEDLIRVAARVPEGSESEMLKAARGMVLRKAEQARIDEARAEVRKVPIEEAPTEARGVQVEARGPTPEEAIAAGELEAQVSRAEQRAQERTQARAARESEALGETLGFLRGPEAAGIREKKGGFRSTDLPVYEAVRQADLGIHPKGLTTRAAVAQDLGIGPMEVTRAMRRVEGALPGEMKPRAALTRPEAAAALDDLSPRLKEIQKLPKEDLGAEKVMDFLWESEEKIKAFNSTIKGRGKREHPFKAEFLSWAKSLGATTTDASGKQLPTRDIIRSIERRISPEPVVGAVKARAKVRMAAPKQEVPVPKGLTQQRGEFRWNPNDATEAPVAGYVSEKHSGVAKRYSLTRVKDLAELKRMTRAMAESARKDPVRSSWVDVGDLRGIKVADLQSTMDDLVKGGQLYPVAVEEGLYRFTSDGEAAKRIFGDAYDPTRRAISEDFRDPDRPMAGASDVLGAISEEAREYNQRMISTFGERISSHLERLYRGALRGLRRLSGAPQKAISYDAPVRKLQTTAAITRAIAEKLESRPLEAIPRRALEASGQRLINNLESGKPMFEGEPVVPFNPGLNQRPLRRALVEAYFHGTQDVAAREDIFRHFPEISDEIKRFGSDHGLDLLEMPVFMGRGAFSGVYRIGVDQNGRHQVVRISPHIDKGLVKKPWIASPTERVTTRNGWRLDFLPYLRDPRDAKVSDAAQKADVERLKLQAARDGYAAWDVGWDDSVKVARNIMYTQEGRPVISDQGAILEGSTYRQAQEMSRSFNQWYVATTGRRPDSLGLMIDPEPLQKAGERYQAEHPEGVAYREVRQDYYDRLANDAVDPHTPNPAASQVAARSVQYDRQLDAGLRMPNRAGDRFTRLYNLDQDVPGSYASRASRTLGDVATTSQDVVIRFSEQMADLMPSTYKGISVSNYHYGVRVGDEILNNPVLMLERARSSTEKALQGVDPKSERFRKALARRWAHAMVGNLVHELVHAKVVGHDDPRAFSRAYREIVNRIGSESISEAVRQFESLVSGKKLLGQLESLYGEARRIHEANRAKGVDPRPWTRVQPAEGGAPLRSQPKGARQGAAQAGAPGSPRLRAGPPEAVSGGGAGTATRVQSIAPLQRGGPREPGVSLDPRGPAPGDLRGWYSSLLTEKQQAQEKQGWGAKKSPDISVPALWEKYQENIKAQGLKPSIPEFKGLLDAAVQKGAVLSEVEPRTLTTAQKLFLPKSPEGKHLGMVRFPAEEASPVSVRATAFDADGSPTKVSFFYQGEGDSRPHLISAKVEDGRIQDPDGRVAEYVTDQGGSLAAAQSLIPRLSTKTPEQRLGSTTLRAISEDAHNPTSGRSREEAEEVLRGLFRADADQGPGNPRTDFAEALMGKMHADPEWVKEWSQKTPAEGGVLNLKYFQDMSPEFKAAYNWALKELENHKLSRSTPVPFDQMSKQAKELLDSFTPHQLAQRMKGKAYTYEKDLALRIGMADYAKRAEAAFLEMKEAISAGRDADAARLRYERLLTDGASLVSTIVEGRTAAARTLAAGRIPIHALDEASRQQFDLYKRLREDLKYSEKDASAVVELFREAQKTGDYRAMQEMLKRLAGNKGWGQKLLELWKAGLFGVPSYLVNTGGNNLMIGTKQFEDALAGAMDAIRVGVGKSAKSLGMKGLADLAGVERERFVGEAHYALKGLLKGALEAVPEAAREMGRHLRLEEPSVTRNLSFGDVGDINLTTGAWGGKLGEAIRTPFKIMDTGDVVSQRMLRPEHYYRAAYRMLRKGTVKKLPGESMGRAVDRVVNQIETIAKHPDQAKGERLWTPQLQAVVEEAKEVAKRVVYREDLNPTEKDIGRVIQSHPLLQLIVPFYKTPLNIAKAAVRRTPLGYLSALNLIKKGASKGEIEEAMARATMGSAVMLGFAAMAMEGVITGGGPTDPEEQRILRATGWLPYSIKIGDHYLSYQRLEPFSSIVGMGADVAEGFLRGDYKDSGDLAARAIGSIADNLTSKTFLAGLEGLFTMFHDPKRYGERFLKQMQASVVPNSLFGVIPVGHLARAMDPTYRRTEFGNLSPWIAKVPVASKSLTPQLDPLGQEINRPTGPGFAGRLFNPLYVTGVKETDLSKLAKVMADIGYAPRGINPYYKVNGISVKLTKEEINRLKKARIIATKIAAIAIKNPTFQSLPDNEQSLIPGINVKTKADVLRNIYQKAMRPVTKALSPVLLTRAIKKQREQEA